MATKFNKQALMDRLDERIADAEAALAEAEKQKADAGKVTAEKKRTDAELLKTWKAQVKADVDAFVAKTEAAFLARSRNVDDYVGYNGNVYRGHNVHFTLNGPTAPESEEAARRERARYFDTQTPAGKVERLHKQRELLVLMGTDKDGNVTIASNNHDFSGLLRDIIG